jgi:hypothetical protein
MATLSPGSSADHQEKWSLVRDIDTSGDDEALERVLSPVLKAIGVR